jgi:predicted membrane-bound spermidine synthase
MMNKEIAKIMATNIFKFVAVIGGYFAATVGTTLLANYLFNWDKQTVFLSVTLLAMLAIGVWTTYDYAKWKVDFDAKYGNK